MIELQRNRSFHVQRCLGTLKILADEQIGQAGTKSSSLFLVDMDDTYMTELYNVNFLSCDEFPLEARRFCWNQRCISMLRIQSPPFSHTLTSAQRPRSGPERGIGINACEYADKSAHKLANHEWKARIINTCFNILVDKEAKKNRIVEPRKMVLPSRAASSLPNQPYQLARKMRCKLLTSKPSFQKQLIENPQVGALQTWTQPS